MWKKKLKEHRERVVKWKESIQYSRNTKKSNVYNTKDHEASGRDKRDNVASRDFMGLLGPPPTVGRGNVIEQFKRSSNQTTSIQAHQKVFLN